MFNVILDEFTHVYPTEWHAFPTPSIPSSDRMRQWPNSNERRWTTCIADVGDLDIRPGYLVGGTGTIAGWIYWLIVMVDNGIFLGYKPTTMGIWWWSGWWFGTWLSSVGNSNPNWRTPSFFRGVGIPPTRYGMYVFACLYCRWEKQHVQLYTANWHDGRITLICTNGPVWFCLYPMKESKCSGK